MIPASLRRCLGLLCLCLASGASRAAERLLNSPHRRQRQAADRPRARLDQLQNQLIAWQARLQPQRIDTLTGIGTHAAAQREIRRLIAHDRPFTLVRLSIDNVKSINKTLGHATGDELLVALTHRLTHLSCHLGRLYRLGGNEFLMLVAPPPHDSLVEHWRIRLCQPLELKGTALIPSITLACLHSPEHGREARCLLRRSANALNQARDSRDGHQDDQHRLDQRHAREKVLLRDLVHAVRTQQLRVVYQPKIRIADGHVEGFEALIQWQHPSLGLLSPDDFLPLAEHSGHMALLGEWLIKRVIRQMAEWQAQGQPQNVAINLSAADLDDPQLAQRLLGWLHTHGVAPQRLMLEVTEQTMMRDPALAAYLLGELRKQGIRVAIDDFGTGYSSLAQLRRLPLDILKIDKSFVSDLPNQPEDAMIVRTSVMLAHNFGLEVVAEGVETSAHLALLADAGCDQAQGFLISHALDADRLLAWRDAYQASPVTTLAPS